MKKQRPCRLRKRKARGAPHFLSQAPNFAFKLGIPLAFTGKLCYACDHGLGNVRFLHLLCIYGIFFPLPQVNLWQTCRKAGTQSQMGLTPLPWENTL